MYDINRVGQDILYCPVMWVMESPIKYLKSLTLPQSSFGRGEGYGGCLQEGPDIFHQKLPHSKYHWENKCHKKKGKNNKRFWAFLLPFGLWSLSLLITADHYVVWSPSRSSSSVHMMLEVGDKILWTYRLHHLGFGPSECPKRQNSQSPDVRFSVQDVGAGMDLWRPAELWPTHTQRDYTKSSDTSATGGCSKLQADTLWLRLFLNSSSFMVH